MQGWDKTESSPCGKHWVPCFRYATPPFVLPSHVYLRFGLLIFVNTWLLTVFIRPFRDRVSLGIIYNGLNILPLVP
ncbi:hypothetical protein BX666DRAFT_2011051, partial [Dichotomocladium elegans]